MSEKLIKNNSTQMELNIPILSQEDSLVSPSRVAGKQKGTGDDRHLWPEMFRIIKTFKPKFVIGENVKGLINIQDGVVFETVCTDLESEGYEVQAFNIPAAGVGAPHRRERIWILATNVATPSATMRENRSPEAMKRRARIQEEYRQNNSTPGSLAEQVQYGTAI
jgi:site-specific DNA-cytosine methylase